MPWANHTQAAARWARKIRERIIAELGGRCRLCGSTADLELHHPNGRAYRLEALSRWQRAVVLKREHARGELEVLCRSCNAKLQ